MQFYYKKQWLYRQINGSLKTKQLVQKEKKLLRGSICINKYYC